MLRWILACAIVANVLFLAWSQHWLAPLGLAPLSHSEPERLNQQIAPDTVVVRDKAQARPQVPIRSAPPLAPVSPAPTNPTVAPAVLPPAPSPATQN